MSKETIIQARQLPVEMLRPFEQHPFQVKDDEEMDQLVWSVLTQGVLTPLVGARWKRMCIRSSPVTADSTPVKKQGLPRFLPWCILWTGMPPPLHWWTAISTGNDCSPAKKHLRIN